MNWQQSSVRKPAATHPHMPHNHTCNSSLWSALLIVFPVITMPQCNAFNQQTKQVAKPSTHLLACQQPAVLLGYILPAQCQRRGLDCSHCRRHCCWLNHGHGLGQALGQQADVATNLVGLQLLGAKLQGAVAVVHTHLCVCVWGGC
jgi:hypothetical protein